MTNYALLIRYNDNKGENMRTFYIFKIKKEMTILTKETPYNLYRIIEHLYYLDDYNADVSFQVYDSIFDTFNKEYVNKRLNNLFQKNRFYLYEDDKHIIDNKYKPENTYLRVYKSHIMLKSNCLTPTLLVNYLMSDNLFVCDFKNKDYFWLNEFVRQ